MKYSNFMIIGLKNKRTATKAMKVIKNRLADGFACDEHYQDTPSTRMASDLTVLQDTMILLPEGNGYYLPKDAETVITELVKHLAAHMGNETFEWFIHSSSKDDFAKALSGGDVSKADLLLDAFKKGYEEATGAWGKELPEISKKTYEAVEEKFAAWKNESGTTEEVAE